MHRLLSQAPAVNQFAWRRHAPQIALLPLPVPPLSPVPGPGCLGFVPVALFNVF